ncbi:kynurenine--oxoglutarate transaminase-like isoform X3 [Telopea speciosissima]|uniref:kynurenine--oxoglutarate transaminase-like isoform X3 n=1 Tax=Telopea speciosissima TaxID=54955 RepID=UPI001CC3553B|nr:kynurenine--oxoglutarate transaminase-like isoform X3 [Telopea speciosissima]
MEEKLSKVAQTLKPSPIQELSHLSQRCNAINLAMGFPDFPAPTQIKDAAISAINSDFNQYRHVQGICEHLAEKMKLQQGLDVNPLTDIAICCGQTEAFAAAVFATIDRGDEVLLFDPAYETYETCILMAGGVPVYEYITFDMEKHISLASLLGMQERTIITSSLSKTFSVTGWRIGWAIAPACIAFAIRNIHVKITDSAPAPFQEAALTALTCSPEYYESLRTAYESKRNYIVKMLCSIGFKIHFKPQGSFFVFAELPEECILSDIDFVTELIRKAGVAAVPGCGFFHSFSSSGQNYQRRYIRFAFCKNDATLDAAAQKMGKLVDGLLKGWKKCI